MKLFCFDFVKIFRILLFVLVILGLVEFIDLWLDVVMLIVFVWVLVFVCFFVNKFFLIIWLIMLVNVFWLILVVFMRFVWFRFLFFDIVCKIVNWWGVRLLFFIWLEYLLKEYCWVLWSRCLIDLFKLNLVICFFYLIGGFEFVFGYIWLVFVYVCIEIIKICIIGYCYYILIFV